MLLPDRESNPGLPRDRRRSSPLDYRGLDRSPIANRSTTSTPDKSKRDISKRRIKYSNCIVQHMAMSGDQILANQNTAQITCTLVCYVDGGGGQVGGRKLAEPSILLIFGMGQQSGYASQNMTYILNVGKEGKKENCSYPKV